MKLYARTKAGLVATLLLALALMVPTAAFADPDDGDGDHGLHRDDPSAALEERDAQAARMHRGGPSGDRTVRLQLVGRGERILENATTDVWVHENFGYLGTFNEPCGTGENYVAGVGEVELVKPVKAPGVPIFNLRNHERPRYVGNLPSVEGSRINDVKVAELTAGDILVHSNEPCDGGKGGFELYNVDDPRNPVHLSSVQVGDLNPLAVELFGTGDVGVHNLFFSSFGGRDYVSAVVESVFDNFQMFDITDPTNPVLVGNWGAEELSDNPEVDTSDDPDLMVDVLLNYLFAGFGASQNRFLHDITFSDDGTLAYLSNWDAGLVLLDVSDPANPSVVSVALNPEEGSPFDGEVNSHAAWPSDDGSIVVETEEDFAAWEALAPPGNLTFGEGDPATPIPGVAISTVAGDDFEANQTGNIATVDADSVTVIEGPLAGNTYVAIELSGDQPRFADTGPITGEAVYIGQACDSDEILNADDIDEGDIAVVRRGVCTFREKAFNAAEAGAAAIVIANNIEESTPWGGIRIWDYADPTNPVLASTFFTECAAAFEPIPGCDPAGTYSVHNVIVEQVGNRQLAFISWYWDGMLVLDVTDPYNPVEIARYFNNSERFLASNGGNPHDFWGVYKVPDVQWIYGSDRNGGLYVFDLESRGGSN